MSKFIFSLSMKAMIKVWCIPKYNRIAIIYQIVIVDKSNIHYYKKTKVLSSVQWNYFIVTGQIIRFINLIKIKFTAWWSEVMCRCSPMHKMGLNIKTFHLFTQQQFLFVATQTVNIKLQTVE